MTHPLKTRAAQVDVETGVADADRIVESLSGILADTYSLMIKTHGVHWNVEGPLFYAVHNLTETQYNDLFAAADVIAERIRALGQLTAMSPRALLGGSIVDDLKSAPDAGGMCTALAEDHTAVAKRLHGAIKIAGDVNDPVTEDVLTARAAFHEKAAWMLRALAKT